MKGLLNIGNNCYINAVIQSAIITDNINESILQAINTDKERVQKNAVIWGYCKLVSQYLKPGQLVDNADYIRQIWQVDQRWREQNDSAEFLFWFAENMKSCGILDPTEGKDLIVSQLSCGHPCSESRIIDTRGINMTDQDIASLSSTLSPIQDMVSQQQCTIDYKCEVCNQQVVLTQTRTPHTLPQVLLVQIVSATNLEKGIENVLTLRDAAKECKYRLSSMYVYHGNSISGHYSCLAINWQQERPIIFHCDDMSVRTLATAEQVNQLMPFVRTLVYDMIRV